MLSMTGFGTGAGDSGPVTITLELRSVNHRFLDVSLKLPGVLAFLETDIRKFLKENVARGRVTVMVQLQMNRDEGEAGLDAERLAQALSMVTEAAAALAESTGQNHPVTLEHLLAVPDLFRAEEAEFVQDDLRTAMMSALTAAHLGLMGMKEDEGAALVKEMEQRLATLSTELAKVVKLAPDAGVEIQKRLDERLAKILKDQIDPQRLAQEVALLAEKANINEECERLSIHIGHFHTALSGGGQVAKRLNFLLQEMHREVNTMGSKTNLMDITQAVISMKDEVESMREQILNLE
ncbi:MAG: hypothetical protein ACI9UK_001352 [Candidatus Krumholzibacteriia bacterium]|jgi:uncharacterized protein (TIGR00255 family)